MRNKSMKTVKNKILSLLACFMLIFHVVAMADGFGVSGDNTVPASNDRNAKISSLLQSVQRVNAEQNAQAANNTASAQPQSMPPMQSMPQMQPMQQAAPQPMQQPMDANQQMNQAMNANQAMNQPMNPSAPNGLSSNNNLAPTDMNAMANNMNNNMPPASNMTPQQPNAAGMTNLRQLPPPGQASTANNNGADDLSVDDQAFAGAMHNMMPLTPDQIKTLHYLFDKSQKAVAQDPGVPPKPTSTSLIVNLSPGATPPVIRLSQGFVTSLVFVDATGAAWPIQAYDLGDTSSFNIQWDQKSNTLMVQALQHYKIGNLAVMLKGLDTPVMVTLMPGQNAVDYRVDLRVPKLGPNANPTLENLPGSESPSLLDVLDGVPPQNSRSLIIKGGDECQAWLVGNNVFLRTTMTILSPAFISTMSSPDGTHAYEIQSAPVILALAHGKIVKLTIEGL